MRILGLVAVAIAVTPAAGLCQTHTTPVARVDVSASIGTASIGRAGGFEYTDWSQSFFRGAGAGFYWTDHAKSEVEIGWLGESNRYGSDTTVQFPDAPPYVRAYAAQDYRDLTVSVAQSYQFGHNAWFHPFLSAGVDVDRQREETRRPAQIVSVPLARGGYQNVSVPAANRTENTVTVRPFGTAGFKTYFSDRTFFRGELKLGFGSSRIEQVAWKAGVGIDF